MSLCLVYKRLGPGLKPFLSDWFMEKTSRPSPRCNEILMSNRPFSLEAWSGHGQSMLTTAIASGPTKLSILPLQQGTIKETLPDSQRCFLYIGQSDVNSCVKKHVELS